MVFDVGANQGDYAAAVLGVARGRADCRIVAFEPSETSYEVLTKRFADCRNVTIVQSAVSDARGPGLPAL